MKCREHEDSREKAGHQFKVQGQVAPFFQGRGSFLCQGGDGGPEVIIYSFILVLFCQGIFKMRGKQIYENQRCIRYISAEIRL